jgi:putative hemolysin
MEANKKIIDVEDVIRSKNPTLLKVLPRFVLSYIKRIVHEDQINEFLLQHGEKRSFAFVDAIVSNFDVKIITKGEENIIDAGGCIFAANHPIGGLDGIALIQAIGRHRHDLRFIVNDILLQLKNLDDIFIGVNKHGKNTSQAIADIDALYASEKATLIFPAGLVSRKQGHEIKDLMWRKSFVVKAKKYNRPIVPIFIEGRNSSWFYNLAHWRQRIGIKANIEMLYLMDEMYFQNGKSIVITFGKPISASQLTDEFSEGEWADKIKEHVYALQYNPEKIFNPN